MAKQKTKEHKTNIPDSNAMLVAIVAIVAVVGLVVLYSDSGITGEASGGSGGAGCVDSDGDDSLMFGAVQVGARITPDVCRDATRLKEQICAGGRPRSPSRTCPAGYTCVSAPLTVFERTVTSARCEPPIIPPTCLDDDGDGYQNPNMAGRTCELSGTPDCDDGNPSVYPGATEVCGNIRDDDCDGEDAACPPGEERLCDGRDDNSDGVVDEDCDDDNDNYCDASMTHILWSYCSPSPNCCIMSTDCDDTNPAINVGGTEVCGNGVDEDCSGTDFTCLVCTDSDGGANPVTEGGSVTLIHGVDGPLWGTFPDFCTSVTTLNETSCSPTTGDTRWARFGPYYAGAVSAECPSGMGCFDPAGEAPAYCEAPVSCSDSDASSPDPTQVGGSITITSASGQTTTYTDACVWVAGNWGSLREVSCDGSVPKVETAPCAVGRCQWFGSGSYCG